MFDMETFVAQQAHAKHRQAAMLEAQREEAKRRKETVKIFLESLASEYKAYENSKIDKLFGKKEIIEEATIAAVKNALYSIFEAALVLDDEVKQYYSETFKKVFDSQFYRLLQENNVTTLRGFINLTKDAHSMVHSIIESAHRLSQFNADLYENLLETHYNNSSLQRLIQESYSVFATHVEGSVNPDGVLGTLSEALSKFRDELSSLDVDDPQFSGMELRYLLHLFNKGDLVVNRPEVLNQIKSAVNQYVRAIEKVVEKCGNDTPRITQCCYEMKQIRKELSAICAKYDEGDEKVKEIKTAIERIDGICDKFENAGSMQESHVLEEIFDQLWDESLQESVEETLTDEEIDQELEDDELDEALQESANKKAETALRKKITEKMKDVKTFFNPYQGLQKLRVIQATIRQNSGRVSHKFWFKLVGSFVYVLSKGSKMKNITDQMVKSYVEEAKGFKSQLQQLKRKAEREKDKMSALRYDRHIKRLEKFIENAKGNARKSLKEDAQLPETSLEIADYILQGPLTEADLDIIMEAVQSSSDDEDVEDKEIALNELQDAEIPEELKEKALKVEAAMYDRINFYQPEGLSANVHFRLQEGQYPDKDDFLDEDEKKMIDDVAKASGKDRAIKAIRDKVVSVIEDEEERTKKREEEEQEMLNKMSPEKVEELKNKVQESSGISLSGERLNMPETLFESIFVNRSKKYIQEASEYGQEIDILSQKDSIMGESIVIYTIHETFNTLGLEKYDRSKINRLMNDYYYGKL